MKNETLVAGDRVEVYRNLHKNCFSVRRNGRVVKHIPDDQALTLVDVKFAVQPAGRAKVLRERKKNVHAFVRGTVARNPIMAHQQLVSYNPYDMDSFFTTFGGNKTPIKTARMASLSHGKVWVNQ